jgi:hypothetical protein
VIVTANKDYLPNMDYRLVFLMVMEFIPCQVKVKFTLEQATKTQRGGGRGIALLFFYLGARWGGWSTPGPGRFTSGKDPVPIV